MKKTALFASAFFAILPAFAQQASVPAITGVPEAAQQAAASIDAEKIRAHVRFLADDLLEGRGPGTRGGDLAAKYIAAQFAVDGLKPAGDNGTYFQKVPLYAVHTIEEETKFSLLPTNGVPLDLQYATDVVTKDQTGEESADIDAPIVFVGYGIDAPEYKWDDYAGVDVKGKVLLVIVNEPPSTDDAFFKGKTMTYYGRWTYKYEEAARKGAVGVLIIHRTDLASYPWDVVRNSQSVEKSYLQGDPSATLKAASWIQLDVARKLLAAAGKNVDDEIVAAGKPGFHAYELPVRLKAHVASKVRRYDSDNVVAELPGEDTSSKRQAVIYSAHYDHLGIDPNLKGDNIYNGAADNGTGCGIILEMARAFADASARPPHSVFFAAVTAEEQGLLGSQYLGMHPPVPAAAISLDLNFDMLNPIGVPLDAEVSGAERTDFYPVVEKTAKAFDLTIQPDQFPSAGHYYRSDHFSFARVGVPSFSVGQGTHFEGHDAAWGVSQMEDFTAHHYHQPSDEYKDSMDFRGDAKMARFGLILGWEASSLPRGVEWQPGDEFEAARKKSEGAQ
ncbi:Zn-dependent M28 family amino/carboxypeptidase [Silvibacterium bohemicum]|uniref:Zn-dependent M28 family amino/carboxypeptidase n=1 Tax=Silvibacterium bohemicum TaxID=1577686 RepID=A0A841JYD8_9BACT|nr:M28 family peptidase [Silvibacterium bohemicum]MBB6145427.1 Zn-dependent M28 family amino/carboxypeptidase [Silvibacterium bohemicum]